MAVQDFDSFNDVGTADLQAAAWDGWLFQNVSVAVVSATGARGSGKLITLGPVGTAGARFIGRSLIGSPDHVFFKFYVKVPSSPSFDQSLLCCKSASGDTVAALYLPVAGGALRLSANNAAVNHVGSIPVSLGQTHSLEMEIDQSVTPGFVRLRIDGNDDTAITINTADVNAHAMAFVGFGFGVSDSTGVEQSCSVGDFVCFDASGSVANTWPGDLRAVGATPDTSVQQQLTPLSGSSNVAMVNENPNDGDTSYVSSSTPGQQDLYSISAIPWPAVVNTIFGAKVITVARKDDAGTRKVGGSLKSGSTTGTSAGHSLTNAYVRYSDLYVNDPSTGLAITQSGANGFKFGPAVVA